MNTAHRTSPGAMRFVALADMPATAWKNGAGLTRDLLAWPDADAWQLRVSVAEVARSGPFSAYPGVARWFSVLQGAGVVLHFEGGSQTLTPDSPPLHFDGADAPGCDLIVGPTLDLNLMARKDAGRAEMARAVAGRPWHSVAPLRAVFCLQAGVLQVAGQRPLAIPAHTLAFTERAQGEAWQLAGHPNAAWWLAFEPQPR